MLLEFLHKFVDRIIEQQYIGRSDVLRKKKTGVANCNIKIARDKKEKVTQLREKERDSLLTVKILDVFCVSPPQKKK